MFLIVVFILKWKIGLVDYKKVMRELCFYMLYLVCYGNYGNELVDICIDWWIIKVFKV